MDRPVLDTSNKPLLILAGPTGVGKSDIAIKLALDLGGEIISADSVAVYRGLDIGSAKPTRKMMETVPHHMVDILDPDEYFGVDEFVRLAGQAMTDIWGRGHLPIITGGTGFYIQALLYDIDFDDESEPDDGYREILGEKASTEEGRLELYEMLKKTDPEYAETVHPNNSRRVIRALEYNKHTGRLFSELNKEQKNRTSPYDFCYVALDLDRESLYKRIDLRVDKMMEAGLPGEVRGLKDKGYGSDLNSMSSIGYKEIMSYLEGRYDLDTAIEEIKKNSRHYAKRQLTWLRRERDVIFMSRDLQDENDEDNIVTKIEELLAKKGITVI